MALELTPAASFRPRTETTPWRLRSLFKGQPGLGRAFSQMAVLSLVLEVFAILMPMLSQWVIDDVIVSREVLEQRLAEVEQRFQDQPITCPPFWGGFRVTPERVEFWQGRESRLHDRIVFSRHNEDWQISRLAP